MTIEEEINIKVKECFKRNEIQKHLWQCEKCSRTISGNLSHLKSHLQCVHKDVCQEIGLSLPPEKRTIEDVIEDDVENTDENEIQAISASKKRFRVRVDANIIIRDYLKVILRRNLSFLAAEDLCGDNLLGKLLSPFKIKFSRRKVSEIIKETAKKIRCHIKDEMKNTFPSLMFDSSSKHGRNVFTVSARFMNEKAELIERTLGMVTQNGPQYGRVLKSEIIELLDSVGIDVENIYSTCTDMGANMLKAANLLIEAQEEINVFAYLSDDNVDIETDFSNVPEISVESLDESFNEELDDSNDDIFMLDTYSIEDSIGSFCSKMFCCSHLLNNAVKDVTKHYKPQILSIRQYVSQLHATNNVAILRRDKTKIPRKDNETRWLSTFNTMSDLFLNKTEYKRLTGVVLRADLWRFVDEFYAALYPVNTAMIYFQSTNIGICMFAFFNC